MKKIIAMLTVTAVLCSFTSCGDNSDDEKESTKSPKKSALEILEEKLENTQGGNLSRNASYEEVINMVIDYMNNKDIENLMKISFPDKYVDAVKLYSELGGISIDEVMMNSEELDKTSRLVEIVSIESVSSEELDDMVEIYSTFELINQYVEENGKDNIDLEELETFLDEADTEDISELYFEVPDVQIVDFIIESTSSTGETETSEMECAIYYIDGEGWKVDMSLMGYVKKSKQLSVNTSAKTIMVASNTSLTELDEEYIEIPDCIISSDHSKNYNVSDDFISQFEEKMEYFLSSDEEYKDYNYIIEIKGGAAVNVAITKLEEPNYIGVYPITDDEYKSDEAFDELYNMYLDDLQ